MEEPFLEMNEQTMAILQYIEGIPNWQSHLLVNMHITSLGIG
jgi:hypothetical protein